MTLDREEICQLIEQLKQACIQAMEGGQFTRGVDLFMAARVLQEWLDSGMAGPMPVDAAVLLAEQPKKAPVPSLLAEAEPAPVVKEEEEEVITLPLPPLAKVVKQEEVMTLPPELEAEADLQTVIAQTRGERLRQEAQSELAQMEAARRARVTDLRRAAERAAREEPRNLERQRKAWRALLAIEPGHRAALDALQRLDERERLDALRQRIEELRTPLRVVYKDIRAVEEARLKTHEMLHGEEIADPDLRRELEVVCQELDELRDEILRASEGIRHFERARDYEGVIERLRNALRAGYVVILDDASGEPLEAGPALSRTLQAYWTDLQERSSRRYNEALRALEDGYPETAVHLLEEAEGLMKKMKEGGEKLRQQVDVALPRAREKLERDKKRRLLEVYEALVEEEYERARGLLTELINSQ